MACAAMTLSNRQNFDVASGILLAAFALLFVATQSINATEENAGAEQFRQHVQPILETYCYGCHGYGESKGGRTLDAFASDEELVGDIKLWWAVMKNVRAGIMPPPDEARPNDAERQQLFKWIESDVFRIDPSNPDPGRVTLRRLNRVEYRNTIRDLMGIDYDTTDEFPADDSGYGFDNIGDVLSLSPLLLEKYLQAADRIVTRAVPVRPVGDEAQQAEREVYQRFFPKGAPPGDATERDAYAREILAAFARRAYRRPVDDMTVIRLAALAKEDYLEPGQTFEAGISAAMAAVLSSPRFLFRVEGAAASAPEIRFPPMDEYSLASRLSYFLWSSMPDDELMRLADQGHLRSQLPAQITRMLQDERSLALVTNFAGQWLRSRDVDSVEIEPLHALGKDGELIALQREMHKLRRNRDGDRDRRRRDAKDDDDKSEDADNRKGDERNDDVRWQERQRIRAEYQRLNKIREMFTPELRRAMRAETERYFEYVMREDRSVLELLDGNYAFLNEKLAQHYGIKGVEGDEVRRVELPADSPRGGLLTQGTFLAVTSNPTRTSPVKRGLYILDNILGSPPPPPPPNIPTLEAAGEKIKGHAPTVRELLDQHRRDPLCHSCHARMDPLGLALENFNALGMWRDTENSRPIDASGTLLSGETIDGIRQLKKILAEQHRLDFYRCLTEKMLTYALGRGLDYYDEHTVDIIVARLEKNQGKFSELLSGIIESAPFQKQRRVDAVAGE
jgi:mono/diheme cytochrome c family protein